MYLVQLAQKEARQCITDLCYDEVPVVSTQFE